MENKIAKKIYFEEMDYSAIYLQPKVMEGLIESHHKRPIIKVTSQATGKSIYRKIRGKAVEGVSKDYIGIDNISLKELNIKDGEFVSIEKANLFHRFVTYYRKNPNEDVRGAWWYFTIGFFLSLLSMIISLLSL
jgi:hypothetical protein